MNTSPLPGVLASAELRALYARDEIGDQFRAALGLRLDVLGSCATGDHLRVLSVGDYCTSDHELIIRDEATGTVTSTSDARALAEAVLQIACRGLASTLDFRQIDPDIADRERAAYDAAGGFGGGRRAVEQLRIEEISELLAEALGSADD